MFLIIPMIQGVNLDMDKVEHQDLGQVLIEVMLIIVLLNRYLRMKSKEIKEKLEIILLL